MIRDILNRLQIRHKLIMLNLFITGIVFLLAAILLFISEYVSYNELLLHHLTSQVRILAINSTASLTFNDQKAAGETLGALKASPNIECAIIYNRDGSVFAEYWRPGEMNVTLPPPSRDDRHFYSEDDVNIFQGIVLDGERIGTIYLRSNLNKLYALMVQHVAVTLITLLVVLAIAFILISRWQKVITEPILNLMQSMKTVSRDKNYALKARVYSEDEIGSLAHGFNDMLEQIRQRDMKLQTEIEERKRAAVEIRRLNKELEWKVEERTSQLVAAQEELVRKEKLAILGQLSGSVGHELRNPLGVINNAIYFLKTVMTGADETVLEYLDIIKHEIDSSQRIITDLLDFARTKTPQVSKVPVRELVRECIGRCTFPENIAIQNELPDHLPDLKADPLQMGQVLQNLITNGIQAMPNGGLVRISARCVQGADECNVEPATGFVEISIADTGTGISPENMKKLFQPLFTTKARGIGLGLTVCRNLTEANGGRIAVESEQGKGTTFTMILPTGG
jgi:signal transduction histidine kinase